MYQTIRGIVDEAYIINTSYSRNDFSDQRSKAMLELAGEEAALVKEKHPELSDLAENQVIKAAMAVLANVPSKKYESTCIADIKARRKYFVPDSNFDKALFFLATHHLYGVYKLSYRVKFGKK